MNRKEGVPMWKTLLLMVALGACVSTAQAGAIGAPAERGAEAPEQASPMADLARARDDVQMARADVRLAEARGLPMGEARAWIEKAVEVGLAGDTAQARELARKASARARAALNDYFIEKAERRLGVLRAQYVDTMSLEQKARLESAEMALNAGKAEVAWSLLDALSHEVGHARQVEEKPAQVVVERGDTLSAIAARPEIYGNMDMWPLLLNANRSKFLRVDEMPVGTVLDIPRKVSREEIEKAIEQARTYFAEQQESGLE